METTSPAVSSTGPSKGRVHTTPSIRVEEAHILCYCELSGDRNKIHLTGIRPVAPGFLLLALISGQVQQLGLVQGLPMFRAANWKFQRSVYAGDSVNMEFTVSEPVPFRGGVIHSLTLEGKMFNQDNQVVGQGVWSLMIVPEAVPK